MGNALVILHVDGLGADSLEEALSSGLMPFTKHLVAAEGYQIHRYRCGIPSTTPFAQAGILYGDNSEIPSFRWWDRERQVLVQFGARSTFKKVADKYFAGCRPLTQDGACIAACYPAGAADDFGIAYQDRVYSRSGTSRSALRVVLPYFANPLHLADWLWHALVSIWRTAVQYVSARVGGRRPAATYVLNDAAEEIFVHHLTRYAVEKAMHEGYSPIYAGFYAFDETGHAFGPDHRHSLAILKQVDHTIRKVAEARRDRYELVVLSDDGQIDTVPFFIDAGVRLGALVADWMPGFRVREMKGKEFGPDASEAKGLVIITSSGGLGHLYMADRGRRLAFGDISNRHPELVGNLGAQERIALVMGRGRTEDVFIAAGIEYRGAAVKEILARYDDADILYDQLLRLNSFEQSGDLVFFGSFKADKQINFEDQAGGHGAFGGEQTHPFVLAKRDWAMDTSHVHGAHELHPILSELRDRLKRAPVSYSRS
ncbi:MAG TPA: alkaline phosphatase family protein [Candidatus Dormibacteraeota bacterium]|nr:alkaline phosphatase family protein [Candidatus Dormibacteraeota bacterium]